MGPPRTLDRFRHTLMPPTIFLVGGITVSVRAREPFGHWVRHMLVDELPDIATQAIAVALDLVLWDQEMTND